MIYLKLFRSLLIHKWYVFAAGLLTGVPLFLLVIHDWTKFGPSEFFKYARYKYLDGHRVEWSRGWLHHLHHNPHHPEYWVLSWHGDPSFYSRIGKDISKYVSVLPMPEVFVREMLADMMATSKQITGSSDIAAWLNENGPKMHFHDDTIILIDKVMSEIGYELADNNNWSFMVSLV